MERHEERRTRAWKLAYCKRLSSQSYGRNDWWAGKALLDPSDSSVTEDKVKFGEAYVMVT